MPARPAEKANGKYQNVVSRGKAMVVFHVGHFRDHWRRVGHGGRIQL